MIPTKRDNFKAVHHVVYEIIMFRASSYLIISGQASDPVPKNLTLESFAIHARNLFYFFYCSRRRDDIVASDFISDKKLFRKNKIKKRKLKIIENKADKQVSHLTFSRINYNSRTKPWKVLKIRNLMDDTIRAFLNSLDQETRNWFNEEALKSWGATL